MIEKLEAIKARFDDLGVALTNPEIVSDNKKFSQLSREYRKLESIVGVYKRYRACLDSLDFAKEVIDTESDPELRDMAKEDLIKQEEEKETLENELRQLLIPKDPQDEKNAILEIRAGTGGDEASLFAGD
ncbi:MAG: PCRF domain-containing protein, partial [Bacteroidetes bacterium]|nr:PCRF domain-containing protein [Bacteroidota bacterium]